MPYTSIKPAKSLHTVFNYLRGGKDQKAHNGKDEPRNLYVDSVGLLPDNVERYERQLMDLRRYANSRNKNELRTMVISFSRKELDPDAPDSPYRAAMMTREMLSAYYADFPAVMFVQKDGRGGCLHVHVACSNVNAITHKGMSDEQTRASYLADGFDKVAESYITLDKGEQKANDLVTHAEYQKRLQNEEIHAYNRTHDDGKPEVYIWKDDMKERISSAVRTSYSFEQFEKNCIENGVNVTVKESAALARKRGFDQKDDDRNPVKEQYLLYELTDTEWFPEEPKTHKKKIPKNLKAKSFKMGTDYDLEYIMDVIHENQRQQQLENPGLQASLNSTFERLYEEKMQKRKELAELEKEKRKEVKQLLSWEDWQKQAGVPYDRHKPFTQQLVTKERNEERYRVYLESGGTKETERPQMPEKKSSGKKRSGGRRRTKSEKEVGRKSDIETLKKDQGGIDTSAIDKFQSKKNGDEYGS